MAKSNEKPANLDQPDAKRGKSRFPSSSRQTRTVLPERPPREVDNEIVSILLGSDPAFLISNSEANQSVSSVTSTGPSVLPGHGEIDRINDLEPPPELPLEVSHPDSPGGLSPYVTQLPESKGEGRSLTRSSVSSELTVSSVETDAPSFQEFTMRWKHGLRKGQLKLCEVLYLKTYALGKTECLTSFAELARLSGLQMRQCFNIIAQLEALRFVERTKSIDTSNKKDQGSLFRFYLFPRN